MVFAFLLGSLLVVPGSSQQAFGGVKPPSFGQGPVPFALLRQSWSDDVDNHRTLTLSSRYSPDGSLLISDGSRAEGGNAIRAFFGKIFERFDVAVVTASSLTGESGELAYDSGSYTETLKDRASQAVLTYRGSYLTIYRRINLQWLIVQQAFTEVQPTGGSPR